MRLDLYQAETARIAAEQGALLAQAKGSVALLVQHEGDKNYIALTLKSKV